LPGRVKPLGRNSVRVLRQRQTPLGAASGLVVPRIEIHHMESVTPADLLALIGAAQNAPHRWSDF
jgi:hypothetical protein